MRYSQADAVQIRLAETSEGVDLTVMDNGTGVSEEAVEHAEYGIDIMRYWARIMKGRLEVTSAPRRGTTVRCVLPSSGLSSVEPPAQEILPSCRPIKELLSYKSGSNQ